ncbi:hypothetical protein BC940DRAFT_299994 [Gongronella butleri]|nr:hypothetical protein BC940DRAFT_299994 [Gongronella butleri]
MAQEQDELAALLQTTHLQQPPSGPQQAASAATPVFGASSSDHLTQSLANIQLHQQHKAWPAPPVPSSRLPWDQDAQLHSEQPVPWATGTSNSSSTAQDTDGWGHAPSYTSILPYTEFGFTSTMIPSTIASSIPAAQQNSVTLNPNQPFSRYANQKPARFALAE